MFSIWRNWQGSNNNKNPPRLTMWCFWFLPEPRLQNNHFPAWKGIIIGLYSGNAENECASEKANMTLLNNFLQEPEFECIFHPAWGKQFVPISSNGSYRGAMQFIFVLKFSKLCRTKDTLACIVPLVIWSNWQRRFLFSPSLLCWKTESIHKKINCHTKKFFLACFFLFVLEPLVCYENVYSLAKSWPKCFCFCYFLGGVVVCSELQCYLFTEITQFRGLFLCA